LVVVVVVVYSEGLNQQRLEVLEVAFALSVTNLKFLMGSAPCQRNLEELLDSETANPIPFGGLPPSNLGDLLIKGWGFSSLDFVDIEQISL
jgi:hypothetical protein